MILFMASAITILASCSYKQFNQLEMPSKGEEIAVITTNYGEMKMSFFEKKVPETVKNFKELTKVGKYENVIFHRVIKDFMIQGGDFENNNGSGGYSYKGKGTYLDLEISKDLKHVRGAVSMARRPDPNSAGSQFFIVHPEKGADFLDGQYAVFGQVFEGLEVIDAIAEIPTDPNDDKPLEDVIIEKVEIVKY